MCAENIDRKPSIVTSILLNRCPRCRRGSMYKVKNPYRLRTVMQMHEHCPVCGQLLDLEPGFYYGTNMISYALAVLLSAFTFLLWFFTIGFSLQDPRFFWWLGLNAVLLVMLQPPLMRWSRSVWIAFFVRYDRNWRSVSTQPVGA